MSNHVLHITDQEELETLIKSENEVVLKFTAPAWCGPCQQFAPHFEKAAEKSDATFVAVDVDKAEWAMQEYGIRSVPTVMLFTNGHYVKNLQERNAPRLLGELA